MRDREQQRSGELNELQHNFDIINQGYKVTQQSIGTIADRFDVGREEVKTLREEIEKTNNVARTQLGEIQLNCHQINKLVHAQHNLREDLNFYATWVAGVESNSIPLLERRVRDLEQGNVIDGLMARLEAMEDRLNTQHEEIAVLRGWVCRCGGQPEVSRRRSRGLRSCMPRIPIQVWWILLDVFVWSS